MRTLLLLALALPAVGQSAPIVVKPYYPTMTGEALSRYYLGHSEPRHESLKGGDYVNREMARGYMDGIKDMTEGTVWCNPGGNPDELNEDIAGAISKLPPQVQKRNAGHLVANALQQLFPCPANRRTP